MPGRFRKVSKDSDVDETLFGTKRKPRRSGPTNVISKDFLQKTTISASRLREIKARAELVTAKDVEARKKREDEERRAKYEKAEARKERMRKKERERKSQNRLTEMEIKDELELNATLAKAKDMVLEQHDIVKTMRRKMAYAQCARIREAQIAEKEERERQNKAFEERLDTLMEIDRLRSIQASESTQRAKLADRHLDAECIRDQIREREKQKILAEERLDQEKMIMKEIIKAQEIEAANEKQRKKEEGAKLLAEVLEANREALREKERAKQREREDDERILKFMADKAAEEEAWEEEKRQLKIAKDKQFYEVANKIKKSQDNRAEIDAQRAKRHQQQQERKEREIEAARVYRQKETMRELQRARKEQEKGKLEHLKLLALQDKAQWHKIARDNKEIDAKFEATLKKRKDANVSHQKELRLQMTRREREREQMQEIKRKEGEELRRSNQAFLNKLEKKKKQILEEMRQGNIPEKFCAEVAGMKISLN